MLKQMDLSRADLNLLVLFETVMEERHVGRAAERLSVSPSAVSHGLRRLRALLGDPLFLRTPRGVVPTARAVELAAPIGDVLARIRGVIQCATPFDPARTSRRFTIGAPDAAAAIVLPPLLATLRDTAPAIDVGIRQLLPRHGEPSPALAWRDALVELEAQAMDVAIIPHGEIPARFLRHTLYEEDFVIALRQGHPWLAAPTLENYCRLPHLVVSHAGDPHGFVDNVLAQRGLARRVALTVPNFLFALAVLADSDLACAVPRRFAALHARRFGIACAEAPIALGRFGMNLVVPRAAMMDVGVAWLVAALRRAA
ncbi:LysR family transcriptional regulator [Cupriavidus respiraculi]|uniref:PCP degradation transcriptional activation protein n=1 Tax=Cupriavidus respiraculi TaxID=195930 RepID=A0ABM8WFI2_9BURK|nr:LysR family transcriptional regulator [Cupriavidus respiraculi]CAG9166113.1 PCP degradation transcriptional activation protein [Cupriavidus respiraculi]